MTFRRPPVAALLALLAMCVLVLGAWPARAAAPGLEIADVDVSHSPEVSLVVTAPAQLATADLSSAFALTEAGQPRPTEVERISADGLEVVLAIDTSGSMEGAPIAAARDAAVGFVRDLPTGTPVAVIGFGAAPTVESGFTADFTASIDAIGRLQASGETALYDAVIAASRLPGSQVRRAIVLLSDGGDTVSRASLDDALGALRDSHASASAVELTSPESDHTSLARIVGVGNGRLVPAGDPSALRAAYQAVTAELLGRYQITYASQHAGETKVVLTLHTGGETLTASKVVSMPALATVATTPPGSSSTPHAKTEPEPSFFQSSTVLLLGAALLFLALAGVLIPLFRPARKTVRLRRDDNEVAASGRSGIADLKERLSGAAERSLERRGARRRLDDVLEQAGVALRAGELVVLVLGATVAGFLLGSILLGPIVGFLLAVAVPFAARGLVLHVRTKRRIAFADQLDELLQMMAGSLRAGYGLLQALEGASQEMESPASDELRRLSTEVRLGRDLTECLEMMSARVDNEDFAWVAQAIRINREVGGDLGEVLDRVAETIRARGRLHRQVRALSAEGRISAYILCALPFVIAAVMSILNPGYLGVLVGSAAGFVLLATSGVLMTIGGVWLRKLIRPVF